MTTASIADIYDAIKHSNGEYCSICFHPSSERKLVDPVFLIQLKSSIKYQRMDALKDKELKVCYLCEAMAARSVRFQQVVTLAASVEAMLTWMTDDLRDAMVLHQLFPSKYVTQEMNRTIQRAKEVEAALQNTIVPQLACSHVLVVGSDTPAAPAADTRLDNARPAGTIPAGTNPADTNPAGTNPAGTKPAGTNSAGTRPSGTRHSSTNTSSTRHSSTNTSGTRQTNNIHPIVIEDSPPEPGGGGIRVSSGAGQLQLQVLEQATGNVVLHPIIIGNNGKMYVPSLKVEVVNNEILKSVSDRELFKHANIPVPAPPKTVANATKPQNQSNNQTTQSNNQTTNKGTMIDNYYDFIKQQAEFKENNTNSDKDPLEVSESANIANKKARLEERSPRKNGRVNNVEDVGSVLKPKKTYAINSATKRPVLQMEKVLDWEDKIPMDVISFMDATDPNPIERIMQPNLPTSPPSPTMGVISDVRTISDNDEEVDNDVLLVENIECIDLC